MLPGCRGGHKAEVDVQDALGGDLAARLKPAHTAVVDQVQACGKRCVAGVCDFVGALGGLAGLVGRCVEEGHGCVDVARVGTLGTAGTEIADETTVAIAGGRGGDGRLYE